jgi:hypothetical protein
MMKTLSLITLLLLSATPLAANTLPVEQMAFDIYLDDQRIGLHQVAISGTPDEKQVKVSAEMQVDFLFVTLFRYQHQAAERWKNNCIVELETTTDDDGKQLSVNARQSESGLKVVSSEASQTLEGCIRTFAYWDLDLLSADYLLNTQNGLYQPARLNRVASQPLTFNGQTYGSQQYQLEVGEDIRISLWYDDQFRWQALETRLENERTLRYLLRSDPS